MAQSNYHLELKVISRAKGHNSVAASAYRSGSRLVDPFSTPMVHDYRNRQGVVSSEVLTPEGSAIEFSDPQFLWVEANLRNVRDDARLCREIVVSLPTVADHDCGRQISLYLVEQFGVAVELATHFDEIEQHNPHQHILFTDRPLIGKQLGPKIQYMTSKNFLLDVRKKWREILHVRGYTGVSELSYAERNIPRLATVRLRKPQRIEAKAVNAAVKVLNYFPEPYWVWLATRIDVLRYAAPSAKRRYEKLKALQQKASLGLTWERIIPTTDATIAVQRLVYLQRIACATRLLDRQAAAQLLQEVLHEKRDANKHSADHARFNTRPNADLRLVPAGSMDGTGSIVCIRQRERNERQRSESSNVVLPFDAQLQLHEPKATRVHNALRRPVD